ncbi:MAG: ATP-binding protein, partial [Rhodothermales bacterium]|nr:ATP-binding protein [Rhodothermales bacterium]
MRRFVERYAIEADFPVETVNSLQLAVDEACANIIEHAYAGVDRRTAEKDLIDIDVIIKPDRFIIRIRDKGQAFETNKYNEPDILKYARDRKSGGFGVHLM